MLQRSMGTLRKLNMNWKENASLYDVEDIKPIRVIDVFILTEEIEILSIRLHELQDVVDYFVIIEANETFTGLTRNLTYPIIKSLPNFEPFSNKIIYFKCHYPDNLKIQSHYSNEKLFWEREMYTRNTCIKTGILTLNLHDYDVLIIGDIDEIPPSIGINYLRQCGMSKFSPFQYEKWSQKNLSISFLQDRLHFNFHCRSPNMTPWMAPTAIYAEVIKSADIELIRDWRHKAHIYIPGGWHLTHFHFGDYGFLVRKFNSFSHQELQHLFKNNIDFWKYAAEHGGNQNINTHCKEVSMIHLPSYVYKNYVKYAYLLNKVQLKFAQHLENNSIQLT
jgi:hypothetical protein